MIPEGMGVEEYLDAISDIMERVHAELAPKQLELETKKASIEQQTADKINVGPPNLTPYSVASTKWDDMTSMLRSYQMKWWEEQCLHEMKAAIQKVEREYFEFEAPIINWQDEKIKERLCYLTVSQQS